MDDFADVTEMTSFEVDRVDAVGTPANGTQWLMIKARQEKAAKAKYSAEQLRKLYAAGHAMKGPGGQIDYPIADSEDLHNAIRAVGRGSGDHDKIRRYIIGRAKAMGESDAIPDNWNADGSVSKAAPDADDHAQAPPAASSDAALPADGQSDSLGDQQTSPDSGELTGQTAENCRPTGSPEATGQQDREDRQAQKKKGKKKRSMTNPDLAAAPAPSDGPADSTPGSGPWEHKDIALGEQTVATLEHALQLARQFTEREKAEATAPADTTKEIDMTEDELVKLLDARDEARRAAKSQEKKAKAKKAAKKAAKAKESQDTGSDPVKAEKSAEARVAELEARLAAVESQPAVARPFLSGAQTPVEGGAFKELEERIVKARNVGEELEAREQLTTAKAIAVENARYEGRLPVRSDVPPGVTPLLTNAHLIGDDSSISGVN